MDQGSAAVTAVGVRVAAGSIICYAPVEMAALLLAASAGLVPVAMLLGRAEGRPRRDAYAEGLLPSLGILVIALALLAAAGGLETIVIQGRIR